MTTIDEHVTHLITELHTNVKPEQSNSYVGSEVLKGVVTKSSMVWDITLCSPLKVNQHIGGTCHLHLQCQRLRQERNQHNRWHDTLSLLTFAYTYITYYI
jgi:hypothetical protein